MTTIELQGTLLLEMLHYYYHINRPVASISNVQQIHPPFHMAIFQGCH